MLTFARVRSPRPASFAREEQAGYMVRAAAELLAIGSSDVRSRARYQETARRLGHALHAHRSDAQVILAASPLVRDPAGLAHPMVTMVCGHEDDPESGVRTALALFLVSDWIPAN